MVSIVGKEAQGPGQGGGGGGWGRVQMAVLAAQAVEND